MAASLVQDFGIAVYAIHGEDNDTYYKHVAMALEHEPHVTMDDGADLVSAMIFVALDRLDDVHAAGPRVGRRRSPPAERKTRFENVIGSMEETTTGVIRLRAMEKDGVLQVPGRSRSTTPRPSTSSTTATAPARAPSTASSAPPTC